jgi:hypothetical protein
MARTISRCFLVGALLALALPGVASAAVGDLDDPLNQWLPSPAEARWDWQWTETEHQTTPLRERYTVASRSGPAFRVRWEDLADDPYDLPHSGAIDFRRTDAGLVTTNWASTPPPPQYPILCASASDCGNSLDSAFYWIIWGNRSPTLSEPLLQETRWNALGGSGNDVSSASRYLGRERVRVPAFPDGVAASKVETEITQAGALGDPYGSGVRTVWWVFGVGPVKVIFEHASGEVGNAELTSTNLSPRKVPTDDSLLPLNRGDRMDYRWRNSKHMKQWSRQRFDVAEVVNQSARVDVRHLKGPINVTGSYVFATRLTGVTNVAANLKAATRARFPRLRNKRRIFTPFDLMVFGLNPAAPVYPATGQTWSVKAGSRDFRVFGATGRSKVTGRRDVRVPAGTFPATVVETTLTSKGSKFGSGKRTAWFASGEGLVKLVFRHGDGSVSTVQRVR